MLNYCKTGRTVSIRKVVKRDRLKTQCGCLFTVRRYEMKTTELTDLLTHVIDGVSGVIYGTGYNAGLYYL